MKKMYLAAVASMAILFLLSCGGDANKPAGNPYTTAQTAVSGEDVYKKTCVACHQAGGEGVTGSFPPLAKSDYLADKDRAILQVLKGKSGEMQVNGVTYNGTMPPQSLNDEEVAAVLTYVYSSFGNAGGPVTAAEVKAIRDKN